MILGAPRTHHDKFKFIVEIDGFDSAAFQKCSEITVEAAVIEYSEGGALIPNKSAGRVTVANVTLERGASFDDNAYDWFQDVADAAAVTSLDGTGQGAGLIEPSYKRDIDVVQQDRDGSVLKIWRLFGAWPMKFVAGDWDNEADEKTIEQLEIAYDFPQLVR